MLLNLNVTQAIEFLESAELVREDQIIPGHFRPCKNSPYGPGFDWLYRYELSIADYFEPLLKSHPSDLTGENSLFHEAMSNAFRHAHHLDPLKPITIRYYLGDKGVIISVADCGKGFNVQKLYKHYRNKRRYFTPVGNGIRSMAASALYGVFYNPEGTAFHLLYSFENNLSQMPPEHIAVPLEGPVEEAA